MTIEDLDDISGDHR